MEGNISFININKSFSGKRVLDSFNHQFELNKVHVILGKSGMGKSVLLKSLMGLIEIDDGEILICLLYTSPSPRDLSTSRMPSSA